MQGINNFIQEYRYLVVPFGTWLGIQLFKLIWDLATTKKLNLKRLMQSGGMPSSHSAVVIAITTMIGKAEGISSPIFAISIVFSFVVMYDAAGVRRAAGEQAHVLNKIIEKPELSGVQGDKKLVEGLGHTPKQVVVGALIGFIVGMIFG